MRNPGGGLVLALLLLAGCGGSSSPVTPVGSPTNPTPPPNSGASNTAPVQAMRTVTVGSGTTSGIDIAVATPANASGGNAELLGVSDVNAGTTATNSGAEIPRGTTKKVVLFGRALNGSMQVTIGGPQDIVVSNVRSVTATDGTAGIAFDATVSGSAALGARTVYLRSSNDDITAFAGGLEVIQ